MDAGQERGCGRGRGGSRGQGRGQGQLGRGQGQGRGQGPERGQGRIQGHNINQRSAEQQNRPFTQKGARSTGARPRHMPGYKKLESLLSPDKEPDEVVHELCSYGPGLEQLLKEHNIRPDMMELLIKLLANVCDCESSPRSLVRIFHTVMYTDFLTQNLSKHIMTLTTDVAHYQKAFNQIGWIIKIIKTLLQRVTGCEKDAHVILILVQNASQTLASHGFQMDQHSTATFEDLLLSCVQMEKQSHKKEVRSTIVKPKLPPPDNFREISIVPTAAEITTDEAPYLRANVVSGTYQDVDHYLDVQFRLLRQDFVEPLKLGIAQYLVSRSCKLQDILIYQAVRIQYPVGSYEGITHCVSFDCTKQKGVKWEVTKRLVFGSLVCLSSDNFATVIFATVADRCPKQLSKGLLDLRFQNMSEVSTISSSRSFIMAESSAYFEAYRHVLKGIQQVTEDTLPLQRYIIQVSKDVRPPAYTQQHMTYDLSPLASDTFGFANEFGSLTIKRTVRRKSALSAVEVLEPSRWPTSDALQLDESQLKAIQAALSQELAIVQGPPGTGKTYIGLKIVQALLHNSSTWNKETECPILVVCYTNHALDQFLEGIMKYNRNVVRVGGRSKSEELKDKNLNCLKKEERSGRKVIQAVFIRGKEVLRERYECRCKMEAAKSKVEKSLNCVIGEDFLQPFMKPEHYKSLKDVMQMNNMNLVDWLGMNISFLQLEEATTPAKDEDEEDNENMQVEEETDLIKEQRMLDDNDEDQFDYKEELEEDRFNYKAELQENQVIMDINDIDSESAEGGWQQQPHQKKRMKRMLLHNLRKSDGMPENEVQRITNVWAINITDRWRLYRYWVSKYCQRERTLMVQLQPTYEQLSEELKEVRLEEDIAILRRASVIGMTTTGAAKHRTVLQRVGPKIVVVEEAAEVLESHIVTTLSRQCQHLILIGDHQQLRPNPTVYRLAKDFNLDMSLFERMINNGVPYRALVQQHRMRPEISAIMKQNFYENLQDHESVTTYPRVMGISSNIFFVDHNFLEKSIVDSTSKSNEHEAQFLLALCKYIIQQGQYEPSQITILTTYVGQLFNIKSHMKNSEMCSSVRVSVVDNFQGEENDIILLSLVRSNQEGNIGFLKVSNRMCVALSRARHGLYCIGNFEILAKSPLWGSIVSEMKSKGFFGKQLPLVCHNHPQTVTRVGCSEDFRTNATEGGCKELCEYRLRCGHNCTRLCHPTDQLHQEFKCLKKRERLLSCGHTAVWMCFRESGKCMEKVEKLLPCGHQQILPCFQAPETASCISKCSEQLPCGHICKKMCGEPCTKECEEPTIYVDRPCGHTGPFKCNLSWKRCPEKCSVLLECSHICSGTCETCKSGRLHVRCRQGCRRTLVCQHECSSLNCTNECPPCGKKCENRCVHSKCPNLCGDPCTPCQEPCPWRCKHHACTRKCSEACDRQRCNMNCPKLLRCGHPCIGLCGEPCPNKCRVCDKAEVIGNEDEPDARFVQLEDCIHVVEVTALDKWLTTENSKDNKIQLKKCPICNTAIRRNLRYGTFINKTLADIEIAKANIFGDITQLKAKQSEITEIVLALPFKIPVVIEKQIKPLMSLVALVSVENQLNLLTSIHQARNKTTRLTEAKRDDSMIHSYQRDLTELEKFILDSSGFLSSQQLNDCSWDLQRLTMCYELFLIADRIPKDKRSLNPNFKFAEDLLFSGKPLTEYRRRTAKNLLDKLQPLCSGLNISNEERIEIVKAVGLSKGKWYKCPKGHVYAIGESGGAMEVSTCPECGSTIGRTSHRLTEGNAVATEMDGAQHAAYGDQANMANYDQREFNLE